jgi:hypothetical protein
VRSCATSPKLRRAPQSLPERPRASQGVPERLRASQSVPERPRAPQKLPEVSRSSQRLPEAPRGSQRLTREPVSSPYGIYTGSIRAREPVSRARCIWVLGGHFGPSARPPFFGHKNSEYSPGYTPGILSNSLSLIL